jgi:hypothetical protein
VTDQTLPPEVIARLQQQLLQEYPEMKGAKMKVSPRRRPAGQLEIAAKAGFPVVELPEEPFYTVTLRKEVTAEDGAVLPLVVRVTVDAEGNVVKRRERH